MSGNRNMEKFSKHASLLLYLLFVLADLSYSQTFPVIDGIPRDTTFNPGSAYKKAVKEYPFIKPVKPGFESEVVMSAEIVYSKVGDRELRLDLFRLPDRADKSRPAIILIHGGGWASGSKVHMVPLAISLAEEGYVCAAVEYRLSPEAKYPAAIRDLKNAVMWMKSNSRQYKIDTNKVAVLGGSAGATLASILGTNINPEKYYTESHNSGSSSLVHAVINMDGILDFTHPAESAKDSIPGKVSAGARWFGSTFKEDPTIWYEASPVNNVSENTCPFLFINSSRDRFHAGRGRFVAKLDSLGIYSEVHTIPDTPHPFWLFHPWFEQALNYSENFLVKVFGKL